MPLGRRCDRTHRELPRRGWRDRARHPQSHNRITRPTVPTGVPATAVTQAGDMTDEDLVRAE